MQIMVIYCRKREVELILNVKIRNKVINQSIGDWVFEDLRYQKSSRSIDKLETLVLRKSAKERERERERERKRILLIFLLLLCWSTIKPEVAHVCSNIH
jgi:hypothetical protein